uniref:Uncharacterized protein n=1 Tax=Rhodocyclus tenuis TaxID=1066 RepID=A0A840FXD8_RHOTE|nr:hypothetical protein [Rhodocyclus tenuis]
MAARGQHEAKRKEENHGERFIGADKAALPVQPERTAIRGGPRRKVDKAGKVSAADAADVARIIAR